MWISHEGQVPKQNMLTQRTDDEMCPGPYRMISAQVDAYAYTKRLPKSWQWRQPSSRCCREKRNPWTDPSTESRTLAHTALVSWERFLASKCKVNTRNVRICKRIAWMWENHRTFLLPKSLSRFLSTRILPLNRIYLRVREAISLFRNSLLVSVAKIEI